MNPVLRMFFILCILVFLVLIIKYLKKKKLSLKYSLIWLGSAIGLLILAFFPPLVDKLGQMVGIAAPASTVFVFAGIFMLLIIFTLTIIVSELTDRVYKLTQTLALLEQRVRELERQQEKK